MADTMRSGPSPTQRRRWPVVILGSLIVHAALLGMLLRDLGVDVARPVLIDDAILIEMEPRPLIAGETGRTRAVAPVQPVTEAPPPTGAATRRDTPVRNPDDEDDDDRARPVAPGVAPRPTVEAPAGPRWRVGPEGLGGRIGRSLRAGVPGCRSGGLTPAEQALCDARFAEAARSAPPITGTGDPRRDARFAAQGAQALAQYEARRRPLAGGFGVVGPADCPGSNFGTGCAGAHLDPGFRQEAPSVIRQDSNKLDGPRRF